MTNWQWWSGSNDECYANGPFETRQQAIDELDGASGCIVEAMAALPVKFSAVMLIDAQYFEDNDAFDYDMSDPDRIGDKDVVAAADAELQSLLDAWCEKYAATFVRGNLFAATRNREDIAPDASNNEDTAS